MGARFSAPVQTGLGARPASCTMGTGSFPGGKERPGRDADPSPLLVPWLRKSGAIPLLPLWALRPVQSLNASTRVHLNLLALLGARHFLHFSRIRIKGPKRWKSLDFLPTGVGLITALRLGSCGQPSLLTLRPVIYILWNP